MELLLFSLEVGLGASNISTGLLFCGLGHGRSLFVARSKRPDQSNKKRQRQEEPRS
jgi:hypothetical protein